MERLRSCYAGGNIGMFDVSYWSYSKVALKQSLTAMQDPTVEDLALKVFNSILIYSGVVDAGKLLHFLFFFFVMFTMVALIFLPLFSL